ncbi:MAG: non-canonical purine NTP pyrophosphatase, partial [Firmicutes bacterium]|nr:non-canonical purine NTP pyrophosphatase [Bacillota bacterium]
YMLLLRNMKDVPEGKRSARFVCAVALALPGKLLAVTAGVCEGSIAFEPRGENGFGYDPVFVPQGYNRSFAELGSNEKDRISHRSKALAAMYPIVEEQFAAADKGV